MKRLISLILALALIFSCFGVSALTYDEREENKNTIYRFLVNEVNLNTAAATGLMANMYYECKYDPDLGDYYYGLYQWDTTRKQIMIDYCKQNGYGYDTLEGQLNFIKYELENLEQTKYKYLKNVENTAEGAYDAGYYWCYYYERPANKAETSVKYATYARDVLFPEMAEKENLSYVSMPSSLTISLGGKKTQQVTLKWYNTEVSRVTVSSSNTGVASAEVENDTKSSKILSITAKKEGSAKITATLYDKNDSQVAKKTCTVKVNPPSYNSEKYKITTSGGVNCRKSPSTSASKVTHYAEGITVTVTEIKEVSGNTWGKTSDGWFAIKYDGDTYASYQQDYLYKITYNTNGGNTATWYGGKRYNKTATLSKTTPKRTGCTFVGWSTSKTSKTADYKGGESYLENKNLTLYAVWEFDQRVQNLSASSTEYCKVNLTWDKASGATGYHIFRAEENGEYEFYTYFRGASNNSYTDTGVVPGKSYSYKVRAYKSLPSGVVRCGFSNEQKITASAKIKKVSGLKASFESFTSVSLTWDKYAKMTGYQIYRSTDKENWTKAVTLKGASKVTYTDTDLVPITYYYRIRARKYNADLGKYFYGEWSEISSLSLKPAKVSGLKKSADKLSWNKISGVTGYQVSYSKDGESFENIATIKGASKNSYTHKGQGSYRVRARKYVNGKYYYGSWSNILKVGG